VKASRGSEQYQATNSSIACWYPRRESGEPRLRRFQIRYAELGFGSVLLALYRKPTVRTGHGTKITDRTYVALLSPLSRGSVNADSGLLSPELAAGIHRVKGVRKLGSRLGNWLTAGEAAALWQVPDGQTLTGKRNRAILAILLGCGLRRRELAELTLETLQRREERWRSSISLAREGTFEPFPSRIG